MLDYLLMLPVNLLKIALIKLTDVINSTVEYFVFQEFTRPCSPKTDEKLSVKAQRFEKDFQDNFREFGGTLWNYRLTSFPKADPPILDMGDQALWHGVYTFYWAIKYQVTKSALDLDTLLASIQGLHLHQKPDGPKAPRRLIRGTNYVGSYQDNCSNDSLTGHLLGIFGLMLTDDPIAQDHARVLAKGIADELLDHNYALVNQSGQPTTYGQLVDGWKTDPLRLSLALAVFKVAYISTRDSDWSKPDATRLSDLVKYGEAYYKLSRVYGPLAKYAKVKLLWWEKTYDTHRAAIHLFILAELETDPKLRRIYKSGLSRIYDMVRKTGNSWIIFLCSQHVGLTTFDLDNAIKLLKEFSFEDKTVVTAKDFSSKYPVVKWGSEYLARQPIPMHEMTSQDFIWQRQTRGVSGRQGANGSKEHNGIDFNLPYYLGRYYRYIGSNE
jgi:hypothetical protein